jgi:hypothetical protein
MTDERFDQITRTLGKATSRRTIFKGLVAAAVGGVLAKAGGGDAEARARIKMACARLGQPCNVTKHTPGRLVCCPHLVCDATEHQCCTPSNGSCMGDTDCCGDDVCRPNPTGLGNRCLPPGDVGAECIEDTDCMGGLACETSTNQCGEICGLVTCLPTETCDPYTLICVGGTGDPCQDDSECFSNLCDPYTFTCVDCLPAGAACNVSSDCCSLNCDGYCQATT